MSRTRSCEPAFGALRAKLRRVVLTEGLPVAPSATVNATIDRLIETLIAERAPELRKVRRALLASIADRELRSQVDEQLASEVVQYGAAGFFVGVSAGLELAALTAAAPRGTR